MRLVRTDNWDDATRGEWEDLKRSGGRFLVASASIVGFLLTRLVTTSFLEQFGIALCGAFIVGAAIGWLEKRRSRTDSAEPNSDPST